MPAIDGRSTEVFKYEYAASPDPLLSEGDREFECMTGQLTRSQKHHKATRLPIAFWNSKGTVQGCHYFFR